MNLHARFSRIPYNPKQNRIDINRHKILSQCFFSVKCRCYDSLIDMGGNMLEKGNHKIDSGTDRSTISPAAENHGLLPLRGNPNRGYCNNAQRNRQDNPHRVKKNRQKQKCWNEYNAENDTRKK